MVSQLTVNVMTWALRDLLKSVYTTSLVPDVFNVLTSMVIVTARQV